MVPSRTTSYSAEAGLPSYLVLYFRFQVVEEGVLSVVLFQDPCLEELTCLRKTKSYAQTDNKLFHRFGHIHKLEVPCSLQN